MRHIRFAVLLAAIACGGEATTAPVLQLTALGVLPTVAAGDPAGDSIRVRVVDASGTPHSGVVVSFAVPAGAGVVSPATATTDAQGRAAARFVTDPKVGANTATATISGAAPVSFTLTTIAGPARSIAVKERIALVDAGQQFTPTITATDANGNAVPASQLTFSARTPAVVSFGSNGTMAGIGLAQTFVSISSPFAADSVLVVVTNPGAPVLQSDLTRLDIAHDTTLTVAVILDMRTSTEKLGSTTIVVRWDPTQLAFVSQVEGSSNAGALVNANAASQGSLTLGLASATGLAGRIELRRLTFKAASLTGRVGTLKLSATELTGAVTFDDLLAKTTQVSYPLTVR